MNQPTARTDSETQPTENGATGPRRTGRTRRHLAVVVLACVGALAGVLGSASPASAAASGGFGVTANVACYQSVNTVRVSAIIENRSLTPVMFRYRTLVWDFGRRTWVHIGNWGVAAIAGSSSVTTGKTLTGMSDGVYDVRFQVQLMSNLFPVAYTDTYVTHDFNIWAPNGAVYKAGYCSL